MNKTVSVIIPAYNAEKYLNECLNSILSQSYNNIEVIVVNDGSTDKTEQIANGVASSDPRVKVISVENGGVSAARNIGLAHANGEYVMFVDVDDTLLNESITHVVELLETNNADMVSASFITVSDGKDYDKNTVISKNITVIKDTEALIYALNDHPSTYSVWGKIYKRDFIKKIEFPVGKRVHEDSFFLFKCFLKKPTFVISDSVIYKYTVSFNSASRSRFNEKFFDMLDLLEIKLKDINDLYPELTKASYNMIVKTNMALLLNLLKTSDKKWRHDERKAIRTVKKYKKYFVPASSHDKKFFFIITNNLYGLYKAYYRSKNKLN